MNHLIIGNKNYSSWSLRPWLLLRENNIAFKETKIPLYQADSTKQILQYSASAKVPAFIHDETTVWDSLAICEYIAELYPEKNCWPQDISQRAWARTISSEMHSGFFAIRNTLPMNCRAAMQFNNISSELQAEIDRICEIWRQCRQAHESTGDFLFGTFSIADAMFAPIVLRFNSYGIKVCKQVQHYMDNILSLPSLQDWINEGLAEKEIILDGEVEQ